MKSHTKYLNMNTKDEYAIINITEKVQEAINESKIKDGIILVNSMHITSSIFINDEESGLKKDFLKWLEELAPHKPFPPPKGYNHHLTGEINGDAHLKRTIMGRSVTCAITNGKLDFGPWEQIFYGEFDGKRNKRILIKVIGE
jgi:secondary thiamine-phosphate synthase enzyme